VSSSTRKGLLGIHVCMFGTYRKQSPSGPIPPPSCEVMFNHADDLAVVSDHGDKALLELGFKLGKVRKAHNEVFVGHVLVGTKGGWLVLQANYIRGMLTEWSRDVGAPLPLNLIVSRPEDDPVLEGPDVKKFRSSLNSWVTGQSRLDVVFSANFFEQFYGNTHSVMGFFDGGKGKKVSHFNPPEGYSDLFSQSTRVYTGSSISSLRLTL